jgi:hypothetical protein
VNHPLREICPLLVYCGCLGDRRGLLENGFHRGGCLAVGTGGKLRPMRGRLGLRAARLGVLGPPGACAKAAGASYASYRSDSILYIYKMGLEGPPPLIAEVSEAVQHASTCMPHGVRTTSAKGPAQVRTVLETRALNMKPLGVVGDPLALLRDLRGADPSSPMDQTPSIGKTFDAIHDRSFCLASLSSRL